MIKSVHLKPTCGLAVVALSLAGSALAQQQGVAIAVQAPGCPGDTPCHNEAGTVALLSEAPILSPQIGVISTGGLAIGLEENVEIVKNQPYQAKAVTEVKQTLSDGSHISQTTTATVARDADGRTARVQTLNTIGPWKSASVASQEKGPTLTIIFDPIAKTHTDFTSDRKVAHVLPAGPPPGIPAGAQSTNSIFINNATAAMGPSTFAIQTRTESAPAGNDLNAKSEDLGTKTINGISATGTRTTNTIPAGTIGNDKDILITHETWYSPDLKVVIRSVQSDPRFGETSYSLTDIQRDQPDPTLFQVPADYSIEKPNVFMRTR